MLQEKVRRAAIDAEIDRAIEEVGDDLQQFETVSLRLAKLLAGTREYTLTRGYLQEILDRIDSRAKRIEAGDEAITGEGLIDFARERAAKAHGAGAVAISKRGGAAKLAQQYQSALAHTTLCQRNFNYAQFALETAKRAELAALEAYQAHGVSRLVRP